MVRCKIPPISLNCKQAKSIPRKQVGSGMFTSSALGSCHWLRKMTLWWCSPRWVYPLNYLSSTRPVGSAKYLIFNLHQQSSHHAHAHKLLDCSHIHQQHSTASTAQPARISSELSARRRWQSKESTGAMIRVESYKLRDDLTMECSKSKSKRRWWSW